MGEPKPSNVTVSVVVAGRNRPAHLETLLRSLREQTLQVQEIIVVDDGSQPMLPPCGETVRLRNETSAGPCQARNRGFRQASGKYVFLFDDDAELQDRSLIERAVVFAEKVPRMGVIAFRQRNSQGEIHWMQPASGEQLRLVPSFFGYGCVFSRAAFEAVGGFFETLVIGWEENELSIRLIDQGFEVIYDPSLIVTHHEDQAARPTGDQPTANPISQQPVAQQRNHRLIHRICWRNTLYTIVARYPLMLIPPCLAIATFRWIQLARAWKQFRWEDLVWGWAGLFRTLPTLLAQRKPVRAKTIQELRRWRREVVIPKLDEQLMAPSDHVVETSPLPS